MNNKILEANSLVEISPGELIKSLMLKYKINRAQLIERMKKNSPTHHSVGGVSKISDVISTSNPRKLPLRDIKPLLDSFPLTEKEKDYYVGELLKAYLPQQLAPYIAPIKKNKMMMKLRAKIDILEINNQRLQRQNAFLASQRKPQTLPPLDVGELEFDNELDKIEAYGLHAHLYEQELLQQNYELAKTAYLTHVSKWQIAAKELENIRHDHMLGIFLKAILPVNFQVQLFDCLKEMHFPPQMLNGGADDEQWAWVTTKLLPRTKLHVLQSLWVQWKEQFPNECRHELEIYLAVWEGKKVEKSQLMDLGFYGYVSSASGRLFTNAPNLFNLLTPWSGESLIDLERDVRHVYFSYFEHLESGWSRSFSFADLVEFGSPSAKDERLVFEKLLVTIASSEQFKLPVKRLNELKEIIPFVPLMEKQTLPDAFENFQSSSQKHTTPIDYLNTFIKRGGGLEDLQKSLKKEFYALIEHDVSKSMVERNKELASLRNRYQGHTQPLNRKLDDSFIE
ncbi:hypothetical protein [Thalassotalea litorea]|uniref:hypothetical protein n=1 Tax=Thalassotalea litorea TaxID=2020715 RepID=UPI003734C0FF